MKKFFDGKTKSQRTRKVAVESNHEHDKQLKERTAYIHNFLSHKRFLQAL